MIAHTAVPNIQPTALLTAEIIIDSGDDYATTYIQGRRGYPASMIADGGAFDTDEPIAMAWDKASPVIMSIYTADPDEPIVEVMEAPEEGCCDQIPPMQASIADLEDEVSSIWEALANITPYDPDMDPGSLLPYFYNNL